MKLLAFAAGMALIVAVAAQPGFAQAKTTTVKGHLVDVMCATEHADEAASYGPTHDKTCLLMDHCVKSGYSVITGDGKVLKMDQKGTAMALDLIKKTDREKDWKVAVTGTVSNDVISVSTLKLE